MQLGCVPSGLIRLDGMMLPEKQACVVPAQLPVESGSTTEIGFPLPSTLEEKLPARSAAVGTSRYSAGLGRSCWKYCWLKKKNSLTRPLL